MRGLIGVMLVGLSICSTYSQDLLNNILKSDTDRLPVDANRIGQVQEDFDGIVYKRVDFLN